MPYPQTFLIQACLSRMLVRTSADFADWRSAVGQGALANDIAIYALACRQAHTMAAFLTAEQLHLLETVTLEELDAAPSEFEFR